MPVIASESGADDRLLRPLCAVNLPPTLPETKGWIGREQMFGLSGRSRRPQIAMAKEFGFDEYAQPAGGCCFLTDESYSKKLVDLWDARQKREYDLDDIMLLKVGRHIRPGENFKLIVAREEGENNFLEGYRKRFTHLRTISHGGPLVLLDGDFSQQDIELAARITARFSQGRLAEEVELECTNLDGSVDTMKVKPMAVSDIPESWYI
jgi:tRNA U34 2-thiouridine synthase MnmA/TrmU